MKVKRGERSNTFCGPAALSLLTGKHVDKCVKEIHTDYSRNGVFRRRSVRGMNNSEMMRVLIRMGFKTKPVTNPFKLPTITAFVRWLKKQEQWSPEKKYLINVTEHYVVMKGIKLFDNCHPEGVFFGKYSRRRVRVKHAWEVAKPCSPSTYRADTSNIVGSQEHRSGSNPYPTPA